MLKKKQLRIELRILKGALLVNDLDENGAAIVALINEIQVECHEIFNSPCG